MCTNELDNLFQEVSTLAGTIPSTDSIELHYTMYLLVHYTTRLHAYLLQEGIACTYRPSKGPQTITVHIDGCYPFTVSVRFHLIYVELYNCITVQDVLSEVKNVTREIMACKDLHNL
jgi:hypothetical protein